MAGNTNGIHVGGQSNTIFFLSFLNKIVFMETFSIVFVHQHGYHALQTKNRSFII